MRGIDHEHIHARRSQAFNAFLAVAARANRRAHAQTFIFIFTGQRIFARTAQILDRHQPLEGEVIIHQQHFFNAIFMQQGLDFLSAGVFAGGHQSVLRGHHLAHRDIVFHIAQIAAGDDADQLAVFQHGQTGEFMFAGNLAHFAHARIRRGGERIANHARFKALHFAHFGGLLRGRHIFVNHRHTTQLRHGNGETRFGNGIHSGGKQGDIELEIARELYG